MLVKRINLIIITVIMMITLEVITKNTFISGGITFAIIVIGYIVIGYRRSKKRLDLLEENCDPQAFMDATEKQRLITGKNLKMGAYFDIDKAAGFILIGEFQKAKDILLSIDKSNLSSKNGTLMIYTVNLITCMYELGEISEAEEIFGTEIPLLAPINTRMALSMKIFTAERLFFLNKYKESKEKFQELLKDKIGKRRYLGILYRLAQIDEETGEVELAKKKYKEVADNGNKLWIAIEAQKQLKLF